MTAKVLVGTVVSIICDVTIKVSIERTYKHPIYKKIIKNKKNFLCHNDGIKINIDDKVSIQETRPFSKKKTWKIISVNN